MCCSNYSRPVVTTVTSIGRWPAVTTVTLYRSIARDVYSQATVAPSQLKANRFTKDVTEVQVGTCV